MFLTVTQQTLVFVLGVLAFKDFPILCFYCIWCFSCSCGVDSPLLCVDKVFLCANSVFLLFVEMCVYMVCVSFFVCEEAMCIVPYFPICIFPIPGQFCLLELNRQLIFGAPPQC